MRVTIPATVAVSALALLMGAAPATAAKKSKRCTPKGSKTLALSTQGRVYTKGDAAIACFNKTGKRTNLGSSIECQGSTQVEDFRFGKGLLGFVESSCNLDTGDEGIRVITLRTGATKVEAAAFQVATGDVEERSTQVADWAMKRNGSLAWVGRRYGGSSPEQFQVWKQEVGRPGVPQKLDEGPNVDPASLAVGLRGTDSPIYWRKGGTVFSATLR